MSEYKKLQNGSDIRGIAIDGIDGEKPNLTPKEANHIAAGFAKWLREKTGREAGERAGQINKLQEQIRKKLAKGKTIPEIAEALEEDEDTIRKLIEEMGI